MTAEFMDIEQEMLENIEDPKPREISKLYDLEYSEMTDEEIELLINYKAEVIANSLVNQHIMQSVQDGMKEQVNHSREVAENSMNILNDLTRHAIDRFERESNG